MAPAVPVLFFLHQMTGHHAAVRHLPELRLLAPADFLLAEAAPGKRATGLGFHRRRWLALDADGLALFIQINGRAVGDERLGIGMQGMMNDGIRLAHLHNVAQDTSPPPAPIRSG